MSGGTSNNAATARTLSRKLTLETPVQTPDGAGGWGVVWTALGALWGQVEPRSGRFMTGQAGSVSATGFNVWVRGAAEGSAQRPVPGQRLVMGGRVLLVEAVTEDVPDGMYLKCTCTEEVAA